MSSMVSKDADILERLDDQLRDQKERIHAKLEQNKVDRYKVIQKTGLDPSQSVLPYFPYDHFEPRESNAIATGSMSGKTPQTLVKL